MFYNKERIIIKKEKMVFKQTTLNIADNTGARLVKCIGILGKVPPYSSVGQAGHIIVSIKKSLANKKIRKGMVHHAVLVQTKKSLAKSHFRLFGHTVGWSSNRAILLKKGELMPLGTRITHFVSFQLRKNNFTRLASLSLGIL